MRVPADCIMLEGQEVCADESSLTGEPVPIYKQHVTSGNLKSNPNPFLFSNTLLQTGSGRALVCAVGKNTMTGKLEQLLDLEKNVTPLQEKLMVFANDLGKYGILAAIVLFVILFGRLMVSQFLEGTTQYTNA